MGKVWKPLGIAAAGLHSPDVMTYRKSLMLGHHTTTTTNSRFHQEILNFIPAPGNETDKIPRNGIS